MIWGYPLLGNLYITLMGYISSPRLVIVICHGICCGICEGYRYYLVLKYCHRVRYCQSLSKP